MLRSVPPPKVLADPAETRYAVGHVIARDGESSRADPGRLDERCAILLGEAAAGDHLAFAELYDLTSSRVFGVVLRIVRDPAQAEEVSQEVFIDIWQSSARFDGGRGSAHGWMTTVAHRRAVDRVRAAESSVRRDTRHFTSGYLPADDDTAEAACRSLDVDRVRAAMKRLTRLQCSAVELAFQGGYTHREVAALLEVPLGTAKARIRDGLIRLRAELSSS